MMSRPTRDYWYIIEPVWDEIRVAEEGREYLASLNRIPAEITKLHAAHFLQSEVCNGGFHQLFSNSTGVLAPEAVAALSDMGMPQSSSVVARAMKKLGEPYPRDRLERQARLRKIARNDFERLNDEFFALLGTEAGGFQIVANNYAASIPKRE